MPLKGTLSSLQWSVNAFNGYIICQSTKKTQFLTLLPFKIISGKKELRMIWSLIDHTVCSYFSTTCTFRLNRRYIMKLHVESQCRKKLKLLVGTSIHFVPHTAHEITRFAGFGIDVEIIHCGWCIEIAVVRNSQFYHFYTWPGGNNTTLNQKKLRWFSI